MTLTSSGGFKAWPFKAMLKSLKVFQARLKVVAVLGATAEVSKWLIFSESSPGANVWVVVLDVAGWLDSIVGTF